jgi:hypothetical protein
MLSGVYPAIFLAETLWLPVEPGVAFQVSHCLID